MASKGKKSISEDILLEKTTEIINPPTLVDYNVRDFEEMKDELLTDLEYLVLNNYVSTRSKKEIAATLNLPISKINYILSKPKAREILARVVEEERQQIVEMATGMTNKGLQKRLEILESLWQSDDPADHKLADELSLGKGTSVLEVLEKMNKMKSESKDEGEGSQILNFFQTIRAN
jgi:hypothetical protein